MNLNKKKIIISLVILVSVVCLLIVLWLTVGQKDQVNNSETVVDQRANFTAEFLSKDEKKSLGISPELEIQVLRRSENGEVKVYKIISDNEEPINPDVIDFLRPEVKDATSSGD